MSCCSPLHLCAVHMLTDRLKRQGHSSANLPTMLKSRVLLFRMQDLHDPRDSRAPHLQAAQLEGESGPQLLQARTHCRRRRLLPFLGQLLLLKDIPVMPACSRALLLHQPMAMQRRINL